MGVRRQVDAVAKVDGIDVLPVTSATILDIQFTLELKTAIETIRKAAATAGKRSGIYATSGEQARSYEDQGFNMVCFLLLYFAFNGHRLC